MEMEAKERVRLCLEKSLIEFDRLLSVGRSLDDIVYLSEAIFNLSASYRHFVEMEGETWMQS